MTNKIKIMMLWCIACLQVACYKDDTTLRTHTLSDITIEFDTVQDTVVHIDKNEVLTIHPTITQATTDKSLTYEWEVNYEVVSTEKDFTYTGTDLGIFPVRLKVSNEDGSSFKAFTLHVNSPYEEGLMVLGEDETGMGTLSFLRKFPDKKLYEATTPDFATGVFALNNPDLTLGKGPADVVKRGAQLYLAAADEGKITVINDKTLEVENVIKAPEFPEFKPYRLNIPDNTGRSSLVLTKSGRLFTIATLDQLILNHTAFGSEVRLAPKTAFVGASNFTMNYFWDPAASRLWNLWYTQSHSKDELAGQELIHFFPANDLTYVLTRDKADPTKITKTVFGPYIQEYFAEPLDLREKTTIDRADLTLKESSITLVNERYIKLVYTNGRDIYGWFFSGMDIPSTPYIRIDIAGEITSMATNPEGTELYVGVYNAAASGLKGSVVVYDMDKGTKLATYEGVADKPVKLYYKIKG